jgi:hypothetical protein
MVAEFHHSGVRFQYPDNWQLERSDDDNGWTVTVQSPDTAFLMLTLRADRPDPAELAETALEALRADYPALEADARSETVAGRPAAGHDVRFFSFDLTNHGWTRAFAGPHGTLLLLCQLNDLETDTNEQVLRAVTASMRLDD